MRQFIRHASDIPVEYSFASGHIHEHDHLENVSEGGLRFHANTRLEVGSAIHINIPVCEPAFEATGIVVRCHPEDGHYDVGVKFEDPATEFAVRMVEQVCHIEQYKKQVLEKEGRQLTGEQAAAEWISKYAEDFPR